MEQSAVAMHNRSDLGDRLDDSGLVVGEHDRNERRSRIGSELFLEPDPIDDAVGVDRDAFGSRRRLQHRTVLDRRYENPLTPTAKEGQMVGFGAAADKD